MSVESVSDPKGYQNIFHWAETQKDGAIPSFATRQNDPYQVHTSHSIPSLIYADEMDTVPSRTWQHVCHYAFIHPAVQQADVEFQDSSQRRSPAPFHRARITPAKSVSDCTRSRSLQRPLWLPGMPIKRRGCTGLVRRLRIKDLYAFPSHMILTKVD